MRNFVFLGPPGAGKGTMAELLCSTFGNLHISTGDMLREAMRRKTPLGLQVASSMERGELIADDLMGAIVAQRLAQADVRQNGYLLDGFPRTLPQAGTLETIVSTLPLEPPEIVLIDANRDLILKRLSARRICRTCGAVYNVLFTPPKREGICDQCGGALYQRADDTKETAGERLAVYDRETQPLVSHYRDQGNLRHFLCEGDRVENFRALRTLLEL